jgi:hypothetical protein
MKKFDLDKFNQILKKYNQKTFVLTVSVQKIELSNGVQLIDIEKIRNCKRRIIGKNNIWAKHFDELYHSDDNIRNVAEKYCRAQSSKLGGINCQKLHHDKIKNNLNRGGPWNKGMKGNYPYSHICSEETKKKISDKNSGVNNGMFGRTMTENQKSLKSHIMKEKILKGEFTPNSNNRNTHWDSFYKNKKFRSSWEAIYQYHDPDSLYENLRIEYCYKEKTYIYIVDFINYKTKTVIEVKPIEMCQDEKTKNKLENLKKWCEKFNYNFILADKEYLLSLGKPKELTQFDLETKRKIEKLYEINP